MTVAEAMARIEELNTSLDDLDCIGREGYSSELKKDLNALKAKYEAEQEALRNAEVCYEETAE